MYKKNQKDRSHVTGISLPLEVLEKVDAVRNDISRSRFILRLIERSLQPGPELAGNSQAVALKGVPT
jgi:metal-responsive CopG/Arc/MetJ family transcriptional regulator